MLLSGCAGTDVQIDAPILEAAGVNLTSKPPPEPDLEEKPPLVVPPTTEKLPEPGERQVATAEEQWPEDPDLIAKRKAEQAEKERERYCREGDWSDDAGIEEFRKNMGQEQRCRSQLGKALSEALGGGSASDGQTE
ncbi:hypothetical protein BXY53_2462 [Dichotomicrobium thermohalophilum]|uniref:Uncharacterized protein n=2 Tax=Dichotomicrobium thermohalophilum TaxID=933063 RepID=A0A397PMN9_9HYPH|nr:hypothetical protein BXY53_2462 [Dichotomicrobium thermohalophilum]